MSEVGRAAAERLLLPLCLASGAIVVAGFFFPGLVGEVGGGEVWLALALVFFGAGLSYLALLPVPDDGEDDPEEVRDVGYLLQVRRLGLVGSVRSFLTHQDPLTFGIPVVALVAFFVAQTAASDTLFGAIGAAEDLLLHDLGVVFLAPMLLAVAFCLAVLIGPWGDIKLGGPDAEPAYTYPVYFSMVFTAGIAAGIVFWGPAEALFHFDTPPPFVDATAHSDAAVTGALMYSLFHWGFSAWSAYLVLGVPIAYFVYQRGAPLRFSAVLTPFLGADGLDHPIARLVDVLAIVATIGGIATSVALVGQQFLTGVAFQWDVEAGSAGPVLFVAGLTVVFVVSAQSGVHRGIRRLSNVNVLLFAGFALLLLAVGPRAAIAGEGTAAAGAYAVNFVPMSLEFGDPWVAEWTVWNWVWWFSWAPFAGLFIAALSRGRRLRSVVATGFVATALVTMLWFVLFGTTALEVQRSGVADVLGAMAAVDGGEDVAAFPVLDTLALGELLIFLLLALIIVFMATSADTSTLVVSILSTRLGNAPTPASIVFWGVVQGAVAVGVLLTDTGTELQTAAVLMGGPIALLSVIALAGAVITFVREEEEGRRWIVGAGQARVTRIRERVARRRRMRD